MPYEPLYTFRLISAVVAPIQDLLACFRITTEPEICRQWRNRERGSERLTEMSPISLLQVVKDIRWDIDLYPIRALFGSSPSILGISTRVTPLRSCVSVTRSIFLIKFLMSSDFFSFRSSTADVRSWDVADCSNSWRRFFISSSRRSVLFAINTLISLSNARCFLEHAATVVGTVNGSLSLSIAFAMTSRWSICNSRAESCMLTILRRSLVCAISTDQAGS